VATDGCDSIRTLNLVVIPPNRSSVFAAICPGNSYLGYSNTGIYVDTLLTQGGCDSIRTLNLVVNPVKYATLTTAICKGESYLGHNKSGIYIDTLNASDGCDSIRTINLTVNNNPKPDLGKNDIVCINDSLILSPGVFENYVWQDGSTGATFTVKNAGKYWVTVTDENGCTAADTIQIKKVYCSLVDIPNAFTPNGDGINDTWDIYALRYFPGCSVSVYSRWGRLVFTSLGYGKPWDGTSNRKQLPVGTYYYVINLNNGSPPLSGYVTIIR
jgi:gliding motility-associated-like protein